eukprot:gene12607-8643_t
MKSTKNQYKSKKKIIQSEMEYNACVNYINTIVLGYTGMTEYGMSIPIPSALLSFFLFFSSFVRKQNRGKDVKNNNKQTNKKTTTTRAGICISLCVSLSHLDALWKLRHIYIYIYIYMTMPVSTCYMGQEASTGSRTEPPPPPPNHEKKKGKNKTFFPPSGYNTVRIGWVFVIKRVFSGIYETKRKPY